MVKRATFFENFRIAFSSLRRHKLRSFLTIIGVIIGVMTVMIISAIISGIKVDVEKRIKSTGTNTITITKRLPTKHGQMTQEERMRKPLSLDDASALDELTTIQASVPTLSVWSDSEGGSLSVIGKNGTTSSFTAIEGTIPTLAKANTEILKKGRWFTEAENKYKKDVALVSEVVALDHFTHESPVGKTLEIGNREFRIVGVLEKREDMFDHPQANRKIYIPINSALRINPNAEDLSILAIAKPGQINAAQEQVEDLLRTRRQVPFGKPNNFGMRTAEGMIKRFNSITSGIFLAMVIISSIGLLIGGIGVMNIMLVCVKERTKEIGIRKAVGARFSDILLQFLVEAASLTGLGGLLGLAIGWLVALAIGVVYPSYVPLWAPLAGVFVSLGIGIVFGLFPAWKAARLDPIESLRYE